MLYLGDNMGIMQTYEEHGVVELAIEPSSQLP